MVENCKNTQTLTVKKVVNGGWGLAVRPDGKTTLIRHGLPGETIAVAVEKERPQLDFAGIAAVITAHPERIEPPCPYYGSCGGCDLQHASYPLQCTIKREILADLLARSPVAELRRRAADLPPVMEAPQPFGYRQRIRLQVERNGAIGFHRRQSHRVIDVHRCLLARDRINQGLLELRANETFLRLAAAAEAIELLVDPADDSLFASFHLRRPPRASERSLAERLCHQPSGVQRVLLRCRGFPDHGPYAAAAGPTGRQLTMTVPTEPPLQLGWDVSGFSQVNEAQNHALIALVQSLARVSGVDRVLDLYCGMGNFSLPLATAAAEVVGLESQATAIRCARQNAERNGLHHLHFRHCDVAVGGAELARQQHRFDVVVCDPPRQGVPGLAPLLADLCRHRLVYVSCDPATLCRDLGDLLAEGFALRAIRPIDMFPQTHHLETVVLLEKH